MTYQNRFLKNILTTASTLAVVIGAASQAVAASPSVYNFTTNTNVSTIPAGDWVNFNDINLTLTFDAASQSLPGITSNHGGNIHVKGAGETVGAIYGTAMQLQIYDGASLTFTGAGFSTVSANDYSGLGGGVTFGDITGNTAGATLIINMASGAASFSNTFDGIYLYSHSSLTIVNDGNIFGGNIGTSNYTLANFNINGNTTIGGANTSITGVSSTNTTIASGKTLTIDSTAHAISWTGAINGPGSLILTKASTVPVVIGSGTPLGTVTLSGFHPVGGGFGPAALGNAVHATTLDVIGGSFVGLDSNATNITNFTSSTNSGSVYYNGAGSLTLGNIAAPLNLYYTGSLTASNASGGITFDGYAGNTPTFIAANNASIGAITILGGNAGTINTVGNATFTGLIGGTNFGLQTLTLGGTSGQIVSISSATDIYASNITHNNITLDTHTQNVTMHGNYSANNAVLTLGNKKITIQSGSTATLAGTLVINATYTGNGQTILDLSGATSVDASGITAITFNIDNGGLTPMSNDILNAIKAPQNIVLPTSNPTISIGTSDIKWHVTSFGVLTYDPPAPVSVVSAKQTVAVTGSGYAPLNATGPDMTRGATALASYGVPLNSGGAIIPSIDASGKPVIDISPSILNSVQDASTETGILGAIGEGVSTGSTGLTTNTISTVAEIASSQHLISQATAEAMQDPVASGMPAETASIAAGVIATGGAHELVTLGPNSAQDTASSSTASVSSAISTRLASTVTVPAGSGINSFPTVRTTESIPNATITIPAGQSIKVINGGIKLPENVLNAGEEDIVPGENLEAAAYGIAAGNSPYDKFGVWGSVNLGEASQKIRRGNPAFKSFSKGASIGVDTMINDRTTIGFNISNSFSNIKYKGSPRGNKTDVSSWIGALYGNYQLNDKWFVRGTALFNKTHINNKSMRRIVGGYGIAQAKYNMISYGGDANIGFTHRFANQVILTPTIGVRLLHNNKIAYTETGNTGQNISSSQKALNAYSSLAGISVARSFLRSNMELTPEAHINAQYGINSKGPKGSFVSPLNPNINTSFVGTSPSKLTTVYGVSFTGSTDRIECSLGGDMTMSDKYVGYQGSVKLKVKF